MIYFEHDFTKLTELLAGEPQVFVVYDKSIESYAGRFIQPSWNVLAISGGEQSKTMSKVEEICRWLLLGGADRSALVVAVGGGTITDLVGFAAGVYKRGIRCGYVPTTLLAQVDASIGGKTAVNLDGYKNEIGIFRMPEFIYMNPKVLDTLPAAELRSGMGELIKTFCLFDRPRFEKIVEAGKITDEDIQACVEYKQRIVDIDPTEKGPRRLLNLGHTLGHAIEAHEINTKPEGQRLTHGECVAAGMCLAARMSGEEMGRKVTAAMQALGLPTTTDLPVEELVDAVRYDKKTYGGIVKMILLKDIAEPYIEEIKIDDLYKRIR